MERDPRHEEERGHQEDRQEGDRQLRALAHARGGPHPLVLTELDLELLHALAQGGALHLERLGLGFEGLERGDALHQRRERLLGDAELLAEIGVLFAEVGRLVDQRDEVVEALLEAGERRVLGLRVDLLELGDARAQALGLGLGDSELGGQGVEVGTEAHGGRHPNHPTEPRIPKSA